MNITVFYSCPLCGLKEVGVPVPAREDEDVLTWMETMGRYLSRDHASKSPHCHPESLAEVKIPLTGAEKIGGPCVN